MSNLKKDQVTKRFGEKVAHHVFVMCGLAKVIENGQHLLIVYDQVSMSAQVIMLENAAEFWSPTVCAKSLIQQMAIAGHSIDLPGFQEFAVNAIRHDKQYAATSDQYAQIEEMLDAARPNMVKMMSEFVRAFGARPGYRLKIDYSISDTGCWFRMTCSNNPKPRRLPQTNEYGASYVVMLPVLKRAAEILGMTGENTPTVQYGVDEVLSIEAWFVNSLAVAMRSSNPRHPEHYFNRFTPPLYTENKVAHTLNFANQWNPETIGSN